MATKSTARKSMAPKRKGKKQYPLVTFSMDGFDGDFTVPSIESLPMRVQRALNGEDMVPLLDLLDEVTPGMAAVFDDLMGEEVQQFFELWAKASGVDTGK